MIASLLTLAERQVAGAGDDAAGAMEHLREGTGPKARDAPAEWFAIGTSVEPVSYTHLTLPTIYSV